MADSTARNFSYISMVLSVSGRVRSVDLQMVPENERVAMLHSYFEANSSSTPMHFDGESLVAGGSPEAASVLETAPVPTPVAPVSVPMSSAAQAAPAPTDELSAQDPPKADTFGAVGVGDGAMNAVSDASSADSAGSAYDIPVTPPVAESAEPMSEYVTPVAESADAGAPDTSSTTDALTSVPVSASDSGVEAPPAEVLVVPAPPAAVGPAFAQQEMASFDMPTAKASGLFWLLPVFFSWLGGLIAFLLVRETNAKQARAMLVLGIGLTVAYALLIAAFIAVGGIALWSARSSAVGSAGSVVTSSTPAVKGTPAATSTAPVRKKP